MKEHRIVGIFAALLLLTCIAGIASAASPTVTLTASPTAGASPLSTTLTWSSTSAVSCAASGGWTGSKATSGSQVVSGITAATTFTLSCASAAENSTVVTYTPPTERTDNTPITGVVTLRLEYGLNGTFGSVAVPPPSLSGTYTLTGLTPGTYSVRMIATETPPGSASDYSNVQTKVVAAAQTAQASTTVTPVAPPKPPVLTSNGGSAAMTVIRTSYGYALNDQVGNVKPGGAECDPAQAFGKGWYALKHPAIDVKYYVGRKPQAVIAAHCA